MSDAECSAFRRDLESALAPGASGVPAAERAPRADRVQLGWHEHLLACPACRAFLAAEQALDALLATLPRPRLPGDLARRVLARLGGAREQERLDDLLDLLPSPVPPDDLAARTLRRLAPERPEWPKGPRRLRLLRGGRRAWRIAAAVLVAAGAWWLVPRELEGPEEPRARGAAAPVAAHVDDELLEALDVLENWELLTSDDLDVVLAELDAVDWTLLEYGSEEVGADGDEERGG